MTHKVVSLTRCIFDVDSNEEAIKKFILDIAMGFYDGEAFEVEDCNCDEYEFPG